ncbi:MAG TPA: hypothetical protein VGG74_11895 [Kofleriaceae bacterium]|jgi:hypothetical protein
MGKRKLSPLERRILEVAGEQLPLALGAPELVLELKFVPLPTCIGCDRRGYHLVTCPNYRRRNA